MSNPATEFHISPSSGVPIYRQIMDQVRAMVSSGRLKAGDLLPSVRQMASDLEINMMTVSKAYAKLESDQIVERVRGRGMRVAEQETNGSVSHRQAELKSIVDGLVTRGQQLKLTDAQILAAVRAVLKERRS